MDCSYLAPLRLRDELTNFLWEYCEYLRADIKEDLSSAVLKHLEYDTIVYICDDEGKLIGVCRFDINDKEAYIHDVAVRPDRRKEGILRLLLMRGLVRFPQVTHLKFNSIDRKEEMTTPVSKILAKEK